MKLSLINSFRYLSCIFILFFLPVTFSFAISIHSFSPSMGSVGTLIKVQGESLHNAHAVTVGDADAIIISKSDKELVLLVMPGTTSGQIKIKSNHTVVTSISNFSVIERGTVFETSGKKITGLGATSTACFGYAVAISSDGSTAVVGGRQDENNEGAFWVYTRKGELWSQQGGKLKGTGAINPAQQGESLAISADGNTILIGGAADSNNRGSVWVFERNGNTWLQQAKIAPTDSATGTVYFGNSIGLSADGKTAAIGGFWNDGGKGAVWIFEKNGSFWMQKGAAIVPSAITGAAKFGKSVSINAAGNRFVAGAWDDNNGAGSAWVFERKQDGSWQQQGNKLVAIDAAGQAKQGCSVAMSATGNTVVIGGYADNNNQGAAWVFERINESWVQQQKLTGNASQPFSGLVFQGFSVSISADGNTIASGGYYDAAAKGAVWIFQKNNGQWESRQVKLQTADQVGIPYLGWSLQLSANGESLISGGIFDNGGRGAAWVFKVNPPVAPIQLKVNVNTDNQVDINWKTNYEVNCDYFNVWHTTDDIHWQKIGSVAAKNNVMNDYHLQHNHPSLGVNLYQIEKVIMDGKVVKSDIFRIVVEHQMKTDWKLFPNPSNAKKIWIELDKIPAKPIAISIVNSDGKLVYAGVITNKIFNLSNLSLMNGVYFVKLKGHSPKTLIVQ